MKYINLPNVKFSENDLPHDLVHLFKFFVEYCFLDVLDALDHVKEIDSEQTIIFVRSIYKSQDQIESFIRFGQKQIPVLDASIVVQCAYEACDMLDSSAMLLETKDEIGDFRERFRKNITEGPN